MKVLHKSKISSIFAMRYIIRGGQTAYNPLAVFLYPYGNYTASYPRVER